MSKVPYGQLALQLLIKRDMRDPNESGGGLPVNITNGSINIDMAKMMAAGGLQVPGSGGGGDTGITGSGGAQNGGWGLWNMVKDAAAAVTPSGVPPVGGFGDLNGGGGTMTNGQAALAYSPDLKLPDGKRLAYRSVQLLYLLYTDLKTFQWCTYTVHSIFERFLLNVLPHKKEDNVTQRQPTNMSANNTFLLYMPVKILPFSLCRMDYVVKETGNSYISAVTSHTAYWGHRDIAFFILTKLFPELEHVPVPADC